jgi:4-amino-4-deoxy-L-arabinose transferase-like glycosyltransferase
LKALVPTVPNAWLMYWLLGGLLFRSIIAGGLLAGWDEAYYYLYSQHLSLSYFDHPVMVALTTGIGPWLTGVRSQFTIRIAALLMYTVSLWLLYRTAQHLFGKRSAQLTVAIASLTPLFMLGFGILTAPDNGLIFFWTGALYLASQEFFPAAINTEVGESLPAMLDYRPTWRIAGLGLLLGLACLSKYHGFLLGLGLGMFCLTSPQHRKALWSPWIGLSLLAFGLTLLPLLIWNWQHDWISFRFHLGIRFESDAPTRFSLLQLLGVFGMEIGYLFPSIGLPLWWVGLRSLLQQLRWTFSTQRAAAQMGLFQRQGFVLWMGLPVMLGFTLLGGVKHIFPAWPAPGLWGMTLLLGYRAAHWPRLTVKRWLAGSGWVIGSLLMVAFLHLTLGIFQKPGHYAIFGGFLTPQQDPVNELIDTVQLNQKLKRDPILSQALANTDFIFTNEYYLGGYLDMAVRSLTPAAVTSFTQDPRGFALWFHPQEHLGENALYITIDRYDQQPEITDSYRPYFERFEKLGQISTERQGAVTETFHVYQAQPLLKPYPYPY